MKYHIIFTAIAFSLLISACTQHAPRTDDFNAYVESRNEDLRLSTYVTAHAVEELLSTEVGRREALSILKANGINKLYIEVYRSGLVVSPDHQQRGLGRLLVEHLVAQARRQGLERLMALTYVPQFFHNLGFVTVPKDSLPEKVWGICVKCYKFYNCDEIAVLRYL